MTDLRTALENALKQQKLEEQMEHNIHATIDEWTKEDTQEPDAKTAFRFQPTNNVSRETFNAVRDNPNKKNGELVNLLKARGFNPTSVGSLLAQMTKQGIVQRDEHGRYTTTLKEYVPIKSPSAMNKQKKGVKQLAKRPYVKSGNYSKKEGIAALDTHTTLPAAAPSVPTPPSSFDPDQLLSTLSFPQVLALYKKIKTLLGEAS